MTKTTAKKTDGAPRRQNTIQMFAFAVAIKKRVVADLREVPTAVVSAAMLAFSKLSVEEQLAHVHDARKQHALGAAV